MPDFAAGLSSAGHLIAPKNAAYELRTGHFSFGAWVHVTAAGVIASDLGANKEGENGSGWVVYVNSSLQLAFLTSDANIHFRCTVGTTGTPLSDGCWHHIAAVRRGATQLLYVDGELHPVTTTTEGSPPFSLEGWQLQIGSAEGSWWSSEGNMTGSIEEVTLWNIALTPEQIVRQLLTCEVQESRSLIGYWKLDGTATDSSATGNNAHVDRGGSVPWVQTFDADVCYGNHHYCYAAFASQGGGTSATVSRAQLFVVDENTPVLIISLATSHDDYTAPPGVSLTVVDPNGLSYTTAQNSDTVFVQVVDGVPTLLTFVPPPAGTWIVTTSAPGTASFVLAFQAMPVAELPETIEATLEPVYGSGVIADAFGMPLWVTAAAYVVATAALAASVVVVAGLTAPAVLSAIVMIAAVDVATGTMLIQNAEGHGAATLNPQAAHMMQLDPSRIRVITADCPCESFPDFNELTELRKIRAETTYVTLTSSTSYKRVRLKADEFTNANVRAALQLPGASFMTASGHGIQDGIVCCVVKDGRNEIVLQPSAYEEGSLENIIFHFLACWTGRICGPELVKKGHAAAFLGYSGPFVFNLGQVAVQMLEPDAIIDTKILGGSTTGEAQTAAVELYEEKIRFFTATDPLPDVAARLRTDLDNLVGPNTELDYGSPFVRIGERTVHVRNTADGLRGRESDQ